MTTCIHGQSLKRHCDACEKLASEHKAQREADPDAHDAEQFARFAEWVMRNGGLGW